MSDRLDPMLPVLPNHPAVWERDPRAEALLTVRGYYTPEQMRTLVEIVSKRWFLVHNEILDGSGERPRCGICKRKHAYLTVACIEVPFTSFSEIIGLLQRMDGGHYHSPDADTEQYQQLDIDSVKLGRIEPISTTLAYLQIAKIRARGKYIYPELRIESLLQQAGRG